MFITNTLTRIFLGGLIGLPPILRDFVDRVESIGGEVESIDCLRSALNDFPQADEGRLVYEAFEARVLALNGSIEARDCFIESYNNLNNI